MAQPLSGLDMMNRARLADAQLRSLDARTAQIPEEMALRRAQLAETQTRNRQLADYQQKALEMKAAAVNKVRSGGGRPIATSEGYVTLDEQGNAKPVLGPDGKRLLPPSMSQSATKEKMSDEAVRDIAIQSLYDSGVLAGYRRDTEAMSRIANARMKVMQESGIRSEDVVGGRAGFMADRASLNKITPMYDAVTSFENTAKRNGKILIDLAKKVDTTGVPVLERWIRAGRQEIAGDPDVAQFNAQLNTYRNEAARILTNPTLAGILTVESMREAEKFLRPGASPEQIEKTVKLLERDFDNRKATLELQIQDIRSRMGNRMAPGATNPGMGAPNAPAAPAPAAAGGGRWDDAKERRYQELLRKRGGS